MRPTFLLGPEAWIVFWSYIQRLPHRISGAIGTTPANAWGSWDASSTAPTRRRGSKRCDSILARRLSSISPLPRPMPHLAVRHSAIGEISPGSRVATQNALQDPPPQLLLSLTSCRNSRDVGSLEAVPDHQDLDLELKYVQPTFY